MIKNKKINILLGSLALISLPTILTSAKCINKNLPSPKLIDENSTLKTNEKLNKELDNTNVSKLLNKNKRASEIKLEEIILEGFDKSMYSIEDKNMKVFDNFIEISFKLKEKTSNLISKTKIIKVEGFKAATTDEEKLEDELSKITLKAPLEKYAKEIKDVDITYEGFDATVFSTITVSITYVENEDTVNVKFKLKMIANNKESQEREVKISGFKHKLTLEELIANELEKVAANIENKSSLIVSDVNIQQIKFSNFDEGKYEVVEQKITKYEEKEIEISFKLKDKNNTIYSKEKILKIEGFKEMSNDAKQINEHINQLQIKLKDSNTTLQDLLEKPDYNIHLDIVNLDNNKYEITEAKFENINSDPFSANFTFKINEKNNSLISIKRTIKFTVKNKIKEEMESFLKDIDVQRKKDKTLLKYDIHELTEEIIRNDIEFDFSKTNGKTLETEKINLTKISFEKSIKDLSNEDYKNGARDVVYEFSKENIKINKTFRIIVHTTDKEIILDQEKLATNAFELIKPQTNENEYYEKIKNAAKEDEGTLKYNVEKKTFSDWTGNELFKLKDNYTFKDKTTFGYVSGKFKTSNSAKLEFDDKTNKIIIKYYLAKQGNDNSVNSNEQPLFGKKEIIGAEITLSQIK